MTVAPTDRDLHATLVARARDLAVLLAANAARTERARQVLPEVVAALRDHGLLSVGAPAAFGGQPVDIDTMFEIAYELGRGCASTAW